MYAEKVRINISSLLPGQSNQNFSLASATVKHATAFQPTESFTLAKVNFNVGGKTGSPTFSVRIETDSSGRPSGTLAWANATATGNAIAANGWVGETALVASGTVSPGTLYHLVIANDSGTPASNNFNVVDQTQDYQTTGAADLTCEEWTASFNGTTWSTRFGGIFALIDGSGVFRMGQPFDGGDNIQTLSSTTAYGVRFTAPVSGNLFGGIVGHLPNSGIGTVTAKLYDTSDTLLGTATLSSGTGVLLPGRVVAFFCFDSGAVAITSGTDYRLVFNDSGSADRLEYNTVGQTSAPDYRSVNPLTQTVKWTQGTTGSWTDTTGKLPCCLQLVMSSVSAGGSSSVIVVEED